MTPYRAIWWDHLLETQGEEAAFAWGEMYERSPEEWEMARDVGGFWWRIRQRILQDFEAIDRQVHRHTPPLIVSPTVYKWLLDNTQKKVIDNARSHKRRRFPLRPR